jgi:hypothetical protein
LQCPSSQDKPRNSGLFLWGWGCKAAEVWNFIGADVRNACIGPIAVSYRVSARRGMSRAGKFNHFKWSASVKRRENKTILKESFHCSSLEELTYITT